MNIFVLLFIISLFLAVIIVKDMFSSTANQTVTNTPLNIALDNLRNLLTTRGEHSAPIFNNMGVDLLKPWGGLCGEWFVRLLANLVSYYFSNRMPSRYC